MTAVRVPTWAAIAASAAVFIVPLEHRVRLLPLGTALAPPGAPS